MTSSPKICPTCKRKKCSPELHESINNHWHKENICHGHPPAEKEEDEMKVADEWETKLRQFFNIGHKSPDFIVQQRVNADVKIYIKELIAYLHEARAQERREMRKECKEAVTKAAGFQRCINHPKNEEWDKGCAYCKKHNRLNNHTVVMLSAIDTIKD